MVHNDKFLKGKSREEMGLKKFEEMEIRSLVMGVDVIITHKTLAKLLKVTTTITFILNKKENNPEVEAIKRSLFQLCGDLCSSDFGKVKNMKRN